MADKIRRVDYFYFEVQDKPGEGARLFGKLAEGGVLLLSFNAFPVAGGKTQITAVPEKPDLFLTVAKSAGLAPSGRKQCFLVQGDDRVGAARDVFKRLADANINGVASAGISASGGTYGLVLFVKQEDLAAAAKALGV
ncbi:MAG TPA: hypothetical protein VIV57_17430 [Anaeromyxobacter sp.]